MHRGELFACLCVHAFKTTTMTDLAILLALAVSCGLICWRLWHVEQALLHRSYDAQSVLALALGAVAEDLMGALLRIQTDAVSRITEIQARPAEVVTVEIPALIPAPPAPLRRETTVVLMDADESAGRFSRRSPPARMRSGLWASRPLPRSTTERRP